APGLRQIVVGARRKKLRLYPQIVQVETTSLCNSDCIMCPHSKITRKKGHMDFGLYKAIVDDCARNQEFVKTFFPFLNGEFFLTPNWETYLVYARDKLPNTTIGIFTNASLLDIKTINTLLEIAPDWINISFDGTSKEAYERIRRKLDFEQVQNNIIQLMRQRDLLKKGKPRVTISIIEMEQSPHELESFYKRWKQIVDEVTSGTYSNWGSGVEDKYPQHQETGKRKPCSRLWYNFTVLNTGDVAICCLDYDGEIIIGDVRKQSIKEIWNGEQMTELRRLHLEGKYSELSLCTNCSFGKSQTGMLI
ncbi:radical SAM/SPASM domain-containing protein, partial [Verrucomicrobiota bacterium]